MRFLSLFGIAVFAGWASLAHAAGFAFIEIPADARGPALRGAVWSPCEQPPSQIALGPMQIEATRNCAIAGKQLPLVVMSHGSGGSFLGHHDTAAALADAGFVIAAVNHPGDSFQDLGRQGHLSVFSTRSDDMTRLIDHLLGSGPLRAVLDADRIGVFGYSRGGFTALTLAGAVPTWTPRASICPPDSARPLCDEIRRGALPPAPKADARIKAVVIADPVNVFAREGVAGVTVPLQLWVSAHGGEGVTRDDGVQLRDDMPTRPVWHEVADAGHFSFLAPCSAAMAATAPELCRDAPGFDRVAFHAEFNHAVLGFFQQHLKSPSERRP